MYREHGIVIVQNNSYFSLQKISQNNLFSSLCVKFVVNKIYYNVTTNCSIYPLPSYVNNWSKLCHFPLSISHVRYKYCVLVMKIILSVIL